MAPVGARRHADQFGKASPEGAKRRAANSEADLGDALVVTAQLRPAEFLERFRWWPEARFNGAAELLRRAVLVECHRVSSGRDGWGVALCEGAGELEAQLAGDRWVVTEHALSGGNVIPLASSGGWQTPAVLRVDVIFWETPHRLSLT